MTRRTASLTRLRMHLWVLFFSLVVGWLPANAQANPSSIALTLNTALANVSQPVTFTATVSPQYGSTATPTGTVTFMKGTTAMGSASLNGNGVATWTSSSLAAGKYSVYASYGGDVNNKPSATYVHTLQISSTPVPEVTLTVPAATVAQGTAFTLNAGVAPYFGSTVPTGTVTFQDGSVVLGSATLDSSGNASLTVSSTPGSPLLPVGVNTLYASYSGDSGYTPAISSGVAVQVTSGAPQAQLTPGIMTTLDNNIYADILTTDIYGNLYYSTSDGVYVVASGSGRIAGVPNPVAGTTYTVISANCSVGLPPCGVPGPAAEAGVGIIGSIQVDAAGNVYMTNGLAIYKIDAASDNISDISPSPVPALGSAPASSPAPSATGYFLELDNSGNLYISDYNQADILRVDAITGVLTLVAGQQGSVCGSATTACGDGGPATSAQLYQGDSIYIDTAGNLYLTDNNAVRKIDGKTGIINTIAGTFGVPCSSAPCGDGGPATEALLNLAQWITGDLGGNLYIADENNNAIRKIDTQGNISTIAGTITDEGSGLGTGALATNTQLYFPAQVSLDNQGNLYILENSFGGFPILKVTAGTTSLTYAPATIGASGAQTVTVANITTAPLHITGITADTGFVQQPVGGNDCTGAETIAPGGFCTLGIAFYPPASGTTTGTVSIADDSSNAVSGMNVITVSGTSSNGTQSNTITFAPLPNVAYGVSPITLNATASSHNAVAYSVSGPATISGSTLTIKGAGNVTVTAYQAGDGTYAPATPVVQSFTVTPATLTVTANSVSCPVGQVASCLASNPLGYTITGYVNGDTSAVVSGSATLTTTATASSGTGSYPVTFVTENLTSTAYTFTYVPGAVTITGNEAQTITFGALPGATYGAAPITLNASASSGLPVTYTVTGPATVGGTTLTVNGAGVITVTAQQNGNSTYAPAAPVSQSFTVNKAALTVTANNQTMAQGNTPGNFTATYSGFVNGETPAVLTGAPAFTTPATSSSPVGTQPLNISQGTLTSANYAFNFVNGVITIVAGTQQTITFAPIPNQTYGVGPFNLFASASSGLPVTYKVQGPATVTGSILNIVGEGTVTVIASQAGQGTLLSSVLV